MPARIGWTEETSLRNETGVLLDQGDGTHTAWCKNPRDVPVDKPGMLALEKILLDRDIQVRVEMNNTVVDEYEEIIKGGTDFPPVDIFFDGKKYWLADGFHRVEAYTRACQRSIPVAIHDGSKREAVLFALGANADHGLRRTSEDKREAVRKMLRDDEWSKWSDREIARRCNVGNKLVGDVRRDLLTVSEHSDESAVQESNQSRSYRTKHGEIATMNTTNIGKGLKQIPQVPSEVDKQEAIEDTAPGWTASEKKRQDTVLHGGTVVANLKRDDRLIEWAKQKELFVMIDHSSIWNDPFFIGKGSDYSRVKKYRRYLEKSSDLQAKLPELKGKVLGCHCFPEACHGDELVQMLLRQEASQPQSQDSDFDVDAAHQRLQEEELHRIQCEQANWEAQELAKTEDGLARLREEIEDLPREIQQQIFESENPRSAASDVRRQMEKESLQTEIAAFHRSEAELATEGEAQAAWRLYSESNPLEYGFYYFNPERPILQTDLENLSHLRKKAEWLRENTEAERIAWLKNSIARAKRVPLEQAKARAEFQAEKHAMDRQEPSAAMARFFLQLDDRLLKRIFRELIRLYHPDKLSSHLSEQEYKDCAEIARVLLEVKRFF